MSKARSKGVRLEIETTLTSVSSSDEANKVQIKSSSEKKTEIKSVSPSKTVTSWTGSACVRKETKHRSGHPVLVLFNFMPTNITEMDCKVLCKALKNALACGGSVENKEIILQYQDQTRLEKELNKMLVTIKNSLR